MQTLDFTEPVQFLFAYPLWFLWSVRGAWIRVELPVRRGGRVVRGACELDLAAAEWLLALLAGERSRG
jgi:hypothetical protein